MTTLTTRVSRHAATLRTRKQIATASVKPARTSIYRSACIVPLPREDWKNGHARGRNRACGHRCGGCCLLREEARALVTLRPTQFHRNWSATEREKPSRPVNKYGFDMNGSLQLFEYPGDSVQLSCEKCGARANTESRNYLTNTAPTCGCQICVRRLPGAEGLRADSFKNDS